MQQKKHSLVVPSSMIGQPTVFLYSKARNKSDCPKEESRTLLKMDKINLGEELWPGIGYMNYLHKNTRSNNLGQGNIIGFGIIIKVRGILVVIN